MSFESLYRAYADQVFNLSFNYVGNRQEAEEVTQDVFLKVHQKMHQFRAEADLRTWIFRITINQSLDLIKGRKRQKNKPNHFTLQIEDVQISLEENPEKEMVYKERYLALMDAISSLSEKQKTAIILTKLEGFSIKEVESIMKLSKSSIESLVFRAKKELEKKLNRK